MTHELKKIIEASVRGQQEGKSAVLATVVDLDGSSYRRPGVRMLILEDGKMIGAVSGGCVEKETQRQAQTVFADGKARLMTYDGRYRLGCEGILYILLEPFDPYETLLNAFSDCIKKRSPFEMLSFYKKEEGEHPGMGSFIKFPGDRVFPVSEVALPLTDEQGSLMSFTQEMMPCFKLVIIGAEHDAVQLCVFASMNGWEVVVVTTPSDPKTLENFPGADKVCALAAEELQTVGIDGQTGIVLMTHNFANDLKYLAALKDAQPVYLGLLGPAKRRERLLSQLMEYHPDIESGFLEGIYGPAGLNIGAETPQEIAVSIIAEILSVSRDQEPMSLRKKTRGIHS